MHTLTSRHASIFLCSAFSPEATTELSLQVDVYHRVIAGISVTNIYMQLHFYRDQTNRNRAQQLLALDQIKQGVVRRFGLKNCKYKCSSILQVWCQ